MCVDFKCIIVYKQTLEHAVTLCFIINVSSFCFVLFQQLRNRKWQI